MPRRRAIFIARTPRQLLTIASPGRDDLIDAVTTIGPCTVPELARFLGRSSQGLYYHIRALRDCGVLLETPGSNARRQQTARYDVPGRPVGVLFDFRTEKSRAAVLRLVRGRLKAGARGFERAFRADIAVVEGANRNLWGTRWTGWLSKSELQEVNRIIARLTGMFRKEAGNSATRRHYELTFAIAPTTPQPPRSLEGSPIRAVLLKKRERVSRSTK